MRIVVKGDNLHEVANPIFFRKNKKMSSAEILSSMQSVKRYWLSLVTDYTVK